MINEETLVVELIEREIYNVTFIEKDIYSINFIEKEIINVTFVDKETITVNLGLIDIIRTEGADLTDLVFNEVPIQVVGALYSVTYKYIRESLQVFLNGLKIYATQIIYDSTNKQFTLDFTPIVSDLVECNYVKQ